MCGMNDGADCKRCEGRKALFKAFPAGVIPGKEAQRGKAITNFRGNSYSPFVLRSLYVESPLEIVPLLVPKYSL
jgi:hypothetical protein